MATFKGREKKAFNADSLSLVILVIKQTLPEMTVMSSAVLAGGLH